MPALEPGAIRLWDSPENVAGSTTGRSEDDAMRLDGASPKIHTNISARDGLIRARVPRTAQASGTQLNLRAHGGSYYRLSLGSRVAQLVIVTKGEPRQRNCQIWNRNSSSSASSAFSAASAVFSIAIFPA